MKADRQQYVLGRAYYRVTYGYSDVKRCYPGIESFIYIGTNIATEDDDSVEEIYYFQFRDNFLQFGSPSSENNSDAEFEVVEIGPSDSQDMLTPEELVATLLDSQARQSSID